MKTTMKLGNPTQKQCSLNRAASKKQIPVIIMDSFAIVGRGIVCAQVQ